MREMSKGLTLSKKAFNKVERKEEKSDKRKTSERKSWKPKSKYYIFLLIIFKDLETYLSPI